MNGSIYSPPVQPGHYKQGEDTRQKRIAEFYVESLACTYICNLTTNLDTLHYCLVLLRSAGNIFNLQASKCRYAHWNHYLIYGLYLGGRSIFLRLFG